MTRYADLERIATGMDACLKKANSDPEVAHGGADDLLADLAVALSDRWPKGAQEQVAEILNTYARVEKWYA